MPVGIREQALDLLSIGPKPLKPLDYLAQFSKDILVSDEKELFFAEHSLEEVVRAPCR